MKVIVCGGRDFDNYEFIIESLDKFNAKHPISLVIEGGCNGADAHANIWARNKGIQVCTYHANWDFYDKKAGPLRNLNMVSFSQPDAVIAFKGGKGTAGIVAIAESVHIPIWKPGNW